MSAIARQIRPAPKAAKAEKGHNSGEIGQTVAAGQLRAFVERVERLDEEIKDLNGDKSEVYKEAKGAGFDVPTIRRIIQARKLDAPEREERDAIFDLYWTALEGAPEPSLARARARVREEAPKPATPETTKTNASSEEKADEPATPVLMQEPRVEAEGQGRAEEHGREEGSQTRLPSDRVENKSDGPTVIAAAPIHADPLDPGDIPDFLRRAPH